MQRSSECIASLAAALAKAQIELVNPEKSLVGTIRSDDPSGSERVFRYASLSTGLDIVRKVLGEHEIAVMQTTAIDQTGAVVNLTTMLAHSSGEWIASDWPVCAVSETATPHRMGAALTYARRYALFTLVGIAGEDDLDAPDLITPTNQTAATKPEGGNPAGQGHGRLNGGQSDRAPTAASRRGHRVRSNSATPTLDPKASAELRDRFVAELNELSSSDGAATWAHRRLAEKNKLMTTDAQHVENAFAARLAAFATDPSEPAPTPRLAERPSRPQRLQPGAPDNSQRPVRKRHSQAVDKSVLAFPEPRRIRDRDHVRFIAKQPCLICGRQPADAHHVRFAQSPALGRKVSDEYTVPLCRGHHREVHRCGDEPVWWLKMRINPMVKARELWLKTHPLPMNSDGSVDQGSGKRQRSSEKRSAISETNPIAGAGPQ
jgi:ERF superfamily